MKAALFYSSLSFFYKMLGTIILLLWATVIPHHIQWLAALMLGLGFTLVLIRNPQAEFKAFRNLFPRKKQKPISWL